MLLEGLTSVDETNSLIGFVRLFGQESRATTDHKGRLLSIRCSSFHRGC